MAQQHSHIPKFGSWDGDNVPYTVYFENERRERGGSVTINPNDPEQNPEAFTFNGGRAGVGEVNNDNLNAAVKNQRLGKNASKDMSMGSESGSSKSSSSDCSDHQSRHRRRRSKGPDRPSYEYNPADEASQSHKSASIPVFGAWDESDPTSGEGFTFIFQKAKEEKHVAATKFPPVPEIPPSFPQSKDEPMPTRWCCLFF